QTGGRLSIGLVRWGAIYRAALPKSPGSVAEATLSAAPEACSPHTRSKMVLCAGRRAICGTTPEVKMLRDDSPNRRPRPTHPRNAGGAPLDVWSISPTTGFFRGGRCEPRRDDVGSRPVCAVMTAAFLAFSKSRGNDLSTPMPEFGFPGLKPGDRWCLCAPRWQEAFEAGQAPRVVLRATHEGALSYCSLADLKRFAVDLA